MPVRFTPDSDQSKGQSQIRFTPDEAQPTPKGGDRQPTGSEMLQRADQNSVLGRVAGSVLQNVKGTVGAVLSPIETAQGIYQDTTSHLATAHERQDAGDYVGMVQESLRAIPIAGKLGERVTGRLQRGEIPELVGDAISLKLIPTAGRAAGKGAVAAGKGTGQVVKAGVKAGATAPADWVSGTVAAVSGHPGAGVALAMRPKLVAGIKGAVKEIQAMRAGAKAPATPVTPGTSNAAVPAWRAGTTAVPTTTTPVSGPLPPVAGYQLTPAPGTKSAEAAFEAKWRSRPAPSGPPASGTNVGGIGPTPSQLKAAGFKSLAEWEASPRFPGGKAAPSPVAVELAKPSKPRPAPKKPPKTDDYIPVTTIDKPTSKYYRDAQAPARVKRIADTLEASGIDAAAAKKMLPEHFQMADAEALGKAKGLKGVEIWNLKKNIAAPSEETMRAVVAELRQRAKAGGASLRQIAGSASK